MTVQLGSFIKMYTLLERLYKMHGLRLSELFEHIQGPMSLDNKGHCTCTSLNTTNGYMI